MKKFNSNLFTFTLFFSPFVFAQSDPLLQEKHQLQHQQYLYNAEQGLSRASQFLSETRVNRSPFSPKINEHSLKIQRISVDLADFSTKVDFSSIIEAYQGADLTVQQVFEISQRLTEVLYRAGYVTSAVGLKSTQISDGHLQFLVYWGKVDQLLVNRALPSQWKDRAMLWFLPSFKEQVFNVHQLDQFIEMMTTSNKSVEIEVLPSEQAGRSHLNFAITRTALPSISLGFNTAGVENNANGRNQATLNLRMGDLIGANDEWNASLGHRFYRDNKHNRQLNYTLSYRQPFSFYTLETKVSQSDYQRRTQGVNDAYLSSGRSRTTNVKLSRTLSRDKTHILTAYAELELKKRINEVANRRVLNRHENKVNLGLSYITNLWNGRFYGELSYANGLNWFGSNALAYGNSGDKTLRVISGNLSWQRPIQFAQRIASYHLRVGGQYSFSRLYADNQFSLGDEYTVRGFKGGVISAENGAYLSQTLSLPFYPQRYLISNITPFIGVDIGQVYPKGKQVTQTIAGWNAGIKITLANRFALSFSYAEPLLKPKSTQYRPVYYFNGSISF